MFQKTVAVFVFLFSGYTFAAGDAGCGLGSVIISKNSKILQLFAFTTNSTLLSQPLGITFGTSNCSARGIVMNEKQIEYFVEVNHQDLSREVAQGHGEKLEVLAQLHGCQDINSQKAFAQMAQRSYANIFTNENPQDIVQNLKANAHADQGVVQLCHSQI